MANIWEKDISILAGNLNLGGNYLVTAVNVLKDIQKSIGDWKKKSNLSLCFGVVALHVPRRLIMNALFFIHIKNGIKDPRKKDTLLWEVI